MGTFLRSLVWCFVVLLLYFEEDRSGSEAYSWATCEDEDQFECSSGECIFKDWLCDGDEDCDDGSDEKADICAKEVQCSNLTRFSCGDRCIPIAWRCDRQEDCRDGRDEKSCDYNLACSEDEIACNTSTLRCIRKSWACDGEADCPNGYDERNCSVNCTAEKYSCDLGATCISKAFQCNGNRDCRDGSDELGCLTNATTTVCPVGQVHCEESRECIPTSYLCDEDRDCSDGSDESPRVCAQRLCANDEWQCLGSNQCIKITKVCDGAYD